MLFYVFRNMGSQDEGGTVLFPDHFPFGLILAYAKGFGPDYYFRPHIHSMGQLYVVLDGSVVYEVDGKEHLLKEEEGFWVHPGSIRSPRANSRHGRYFIAVYELDPDPGPVSEMASPFRLNREARRDVLRFAESLNSNSRNTVRRILFEKLCLSILGDAFFDRLERLHDSVPISPGLEPPQVARAEVLMQANAGHPLSVDELARLTGVSRATLGRLFKRYRGQSPAVRCQELRLLQAKQLLQQTGESITTIAMATGFSSSQHFSTTFKRAFGISPLRFRKLS